MPTPARYLERPLALSPELVRRRMFEGLQVPAEMLQEAVDTTKKLLKAKKTVFFSNRGKVSDVREVDDTELQLRAADQVYSMSGMYVREKDARPIAPAFAMEVDATTGVVRIIVGGDVSPERGDAYALAPPETIAVPCDARPQSDAAEADVPTVDRPTTKGAPSSSVASLAQQRRRRLERIASQDAVAKVLFDEVDD